MPKKGKLEDYLIKDNDKLFLVFRILYSKAEYLPLSLVVI
jgi:hypothetical protein